MQRDSSPASLRSLKLKDSPSEVSEDKKEIKSENQSLLGAVEPLDWLFTADSEPEPLSSPKLVNVSGFLYFNIHDF